MPALTTPPPDGTGTVWRCGPWAGSCAAAPSRTGCCSCCPTPAPTTTSASPSARCRWADMRTVVSGAWRTPPGRQPFSGGKASAPCASSPAPIRSWTTPGVSTARAGAHPHRRMAGGRGQPPAVRPTHPHIKAHRLVAPSGVLLSQSRRPCRSVNGSSTPAFLPRTGRDAGRQCAPPWCRSSRRRPSRRCPAWRVRRRQTPPVGNRTPPGHPP